MFLKLIILMSLLTGCATVACDPDHPSYGKDCYECTRKAKLEAERAKEGASSIKDRTESCLRERGYTKEQKEG